MGTMKVCFQCGTIFELKDWEDPTLMYLCDECGKPYVQQYVNKLKKKNWLVL